MSGLSRMRFEFVEFIPKELDEGVLYISIPYSTSVHKCACGCGSKITLPINPAKWRLTFDGETISLWPSVGNWSYPCQSHYWIKENRIEWASGWSADMIAAARARDRADGQHYLRVRAGAEGTRPRGSERRRRFIDRVRGLFRR